MGSIDNIFVLHGVINYMLNENKKLYVAFIDYTKAFDYVVREIYGINFWTTDLEANIWCNKIYVWEYQIQDEAW